MQLSLLPCSLLIYPGRNQTSKTELAGKTALVGVDLAGGSIVDFQLVEHGLNPLTWNYPEKGELEPRSMGHFICFDRLGHPSPQERKNGMPFHGEASHVVWRILSPPVKKDGTITAEMSCELPLGGMSVKRTMSLYENSPVLVVREEITNINKLGRIYNIVQHPSIAPPFLDESVLVDSNASKGFWVGNPMPCPEEPVVYWPSIIYKEKLVDLRRLVDNHDPGVVSFITAVGEEYGWITACNPGKGLLIGYIWKISDYPWIRIWRNVRNGKPFACGLEFGTTPLPLPFSDIITRGAIFDRSVYEYLDSEQSIVKSYVAFLSEIPLNYKGVRDIHYNNGEITIKEHGGNEAIDIIVYIR